MTEAIDTPLSEEFLDKQRRYVRRFMLGHRPELRTLQEGRILGTESKGWRNISEHCLVAGMMSDTLGRLLHLSDEDRTEVVSVALTHDWDKRVDLETAQEAKSQGSTGTTIVQYNLEKYRDLERKKTGVLRVSGNDWRDYSTWGIAEKILRYVDSSIGTDNKGKSTIVNWRERLKNLEQRHPGLNQQEGEAFYGMPLYTKLTLIMEQLEMEFYERIRASNPAIVENYPDHSQLNTLILDQLIQNISNS